MSKKTLVVFHSGEQDGTALEGKGDLSHLPMVPGPDGWEVQAGVHPSPLLAGERAPPSLLDRALHTALPGKVREP